MRHAIFLAVLLTSSFPGFLRARLTRQWSYKEMFDAADLIAIAEVVSTKDTGARTTLSDYDTSLVVAGVITEFKVLLVVKGPKDIGKFELHHYSYQSPDQEPAVADTPDLVRIEPGKHPTFLLFLAKEQNGSYAPVTGQTDPAMLSVLELKGGAN